MEAESHAVTRSKPESSARLLPGASDRGILGADRAKAAFRRELAFAALVIPLGRWVGRDGLERALLIAPVPLVELLNSAIDR